jgi:hypothetical protein
VRFHLLSVAGALLRVLYEAGRRMRDRHVIKAEAKAIAAKLMASLRAGKIQVIGIQTISAACDEATHGLWNNDDFEQLVNLTVRAVVESV